MLREPSSLQQLRFSMCSLQFSSVEVTHLTLSNVSTLTKLQEEIRSPTNQTTSP